MFFFYLWATLPEINILYLIYISLKLLSEYFTIVISNHLNKKKYIVAARLLGGY